MKRGSFLPGFGTRQVTLNETPPTLSWNLPNPMPLIQFLTSWYFFALPQLGSALSHRSTPLHLLQVL